MDNVNESKRSISDKWIQNNVYEALETIEMCERRMFNGFSDLIEYIQLNGFEARINELQIQNMKLILCEYNILLENVKEILIEDDYKSCKKVIIKCTEVFENGIIVKGKREYIYKRVSNKISGTSSLSLTPLFPLIADDLSKLRSTIIGHLSHILYLKSKTPSGSKEV